ncbi:MAG: ferredoxin [Selenomonas sp.]|uniref:ferredoxin n=1 Tax=Selenomonas sp. TaxID=2053611 RepID=UPI0025E719B2|nr:ferredoxin [Selenomonas sp.]MCR5758639.1 ferredoxin [Selenomonas sp.]
MRAYVEKKICVACGMCVDACPEVFHFGEDGLAEGKKEIPQYIVDDVWQAAEDCPVEAICLK